MSGRHLVPCEACGRHVRAAETACPFCNAALLGVAPEPALPAGRLSRAALVAFGLAIAGPACNNSNGNNNGTITQGGSTSSGGEGASTGNGVDGDGGAPVSTDDGGTASDADASAQPDDAGAIVAMYGAPVARYGAPAVNPGNNGPGPIVTRYGAPALCDEV